MEVHKFLIFFLELTKAHYYSYWAPVNYITSIQSSEQTFHEKLDPNLSKEMENLVFSLVNLLICRLEHYTKLLSLCLALQNYNFTEFNKRCTDINNFTPSLN